MGCCGSAPKFVVNDKYPGQDLETYKAFQTIYLKDEEINKMYEAFNKFDVNGSGEVSYLEFLTILDLEETPITREVFSEMDDSHDWNMSFREFVLNMWQFCTRSKQSISTFAFDIFDDDDNGSLNTEEITDMVQRIYGKKGLSHDLRLIIKKMDKNKDGKIDKKEFGATVDKFPGLLFPAFHLQTTFREHCIGEKFWIEKQLQAQSVRKMPEVIELFEHRGGKMAKRKVETKKKVADKQNRRASTKSSKVAPDYDGIDLGAEMSEERIKSEHKSANRSIEKRGGNKMDDEEEAARVIQAAQIRKKNKKKRDQKKKDKEEQDHAAHVIQTATIKKKYKKKQKERDAMIDNHAY